MEHTTETPVRQEQPVFEKTETAFEGGLDPTSEVDRGGGMSKIPEDDLPVNGLLRRLIPLRHSKQRQRPPLGAVSTLPPKRQGGCLSKISQAHPSVNQGDLRDVGIVLTVTPLPLYHYVSKPR